MGSALLNTTTEPEFASGGDSALRSRQAEPAAPPETAEALRAQVAERLAAHRRRRAGEQAQPSIPEPARPANSRSAQIAAAVAERYARTQTYRAFLAAEAERAIQQARAAAEVAALNAQAVAAAQLRLLEAFDEHAVQSANHAEAQAAAIHDGQQDRVDAALRAEAPAEQNLWPDLEPASSHAGDATTRPARSARRAAAANPPSADLGNASGKTAPAHSGLTVKLYEDAASAAHVDLGQPHHAAFAARTNRREEFNDAEARALDEEIAFRHAPVFEEPAGPPVPLPANLIEFPRQLVASRKARPRIAEGPLRSEGEAAPGDSQLRIFEVDPAQISTKPEADPTETPAPQWPSIWLDTPPEASEMEDGPALDVALAGDADDVAEPGAVAAPPIQSASIARRMLAGAINSAIVLAGAMLFAATFVAMVVKLGGGTVAWHPGGSHLQALRQICASIAAQTGLQPIQAAIAGVGAAVMLTLIYQALFFRFSEATPGMLRARIAFCTFDDENPTRHAIRSRGCAMLLSACPLGMGFVWAALDEDRLTWHDRMTKMYLRSY